MARHCASLTLLAWCRGAGTRFDPAASGAFALDSPPVPWLDLGWIESFERFYDTPTDVVRSGTNAFPAVQFRGPIEARTIAACSRRFGSPSLRRSIHSRKFGSGLAVKTMAKADPSTA